MPRPENDTACHRTCIKRTSPVSVLLIHLYWTAHVLVVCMHPDGKDVGHAGKPKAIPWTHTTPIRCAVDAWSVGDVQPRDVLAWPTNLGWMMGPWLLYAALLNGATMALFHVRILPSTGTP